MSDTINRHIYELSDEISEQKQAEESLRTILHSISDAVITTDTESVITRLNPVAEKLTGWTLEEASGKPLTEVFNIVNSRTKEPCVSPVRRVLEEGVSVGLANHTLLSARNGVEHQIADSAAPIRNDHGKVTGAVLVFKDMTKDSALQEQLRTMAFLVESAAIPIVMSDLDGVLTYVNPVFLRTWGYDNAEQVIGRSIADFWMVGERLEEIKQTMRNGGRMFNDNIRAQRCDGTPFFVQISAAMVCDDAGRPLAMMSSSLDITERKRAEEELRKSEFFLMETQKIARVGGWMLNPETDFLAWTKGVYDIIGAPLNRAPGLQEGLKYYLPEYIPILQDRIQRSYTQGEPFSEECEVITDSGTRLWTEVRGVARIIEGKTAYVVGTFQDITDRKHAEEELRHLRNYLSNIINSMPSILVGVDLNGKVTQWNSEAQRTTGIPSESAMGQPLAQAFPRLSNKEMDRIREAMQTRQVYSDLRVAHQQNSKTYYEDVTIYPLIDNGVIGAVIRVDDITERVRLEEMMIQSEKMISVGGLAAGMAHEINNPLAGIMQTSDVMRNRLSDEHMLANQRAAKAAGISMEAIHAYMEERGILRMASSICESGRRVVGIVDNMLSFARKSDAAVSSHDLTKLLDKILELAATDYDLKKQYDFKTIKIVKEYAEVIPSVPCEDVKIQQVLLNILRNGAQAMQEAKVDNPTFTLRTYHKPEHGMVCIEIEDNGPGMNETIRKRIFEPFFTTKPVGLGTGLGLSVSYFIINENHNGKISVESEPGKGTRFVICLPSEGKGVQP